MNPVLLVRGGLSDYVTDADLPEMVKLFPSYFDQNPCKRFTLGSCGCAGGILLNCT